MKKILFLLFLFVFIQTQAQTPKNVIKSYFVTGAIPTQSQFSAFIDNSYNEVTSNILQGFGFPSILYQPWSAKGNGRLYTGVINPDGTLRLNYDGYFYATHIYSDGYRVCESRGTVLSKFNINSTSNQDFLLYNTLTGNFENYSLAQIKNLILDTTIVASVYALRDSIKDLRDLYNTTKDTVLINTHYVISDGDSLWVEKPLGVFKQRIDSIVVGTVGGTTPSDGIFKWDADSNAYWPYEDYESAPKGVFYYDDQGIINIDTTISINSKDFIGVRGSSNNYVGVEAVSFFSYGLWAYSNEGYAHAKIGNEGDSVVFKKNGSIEQYSGGSKVFSTDASGTIIQSQPTCEFTDDCPKISEISSCIGNPSTAGAGAIRNVKDTSSGNVYLFISNGSNWNWTKLQSPCIE